MAKPENRDKSGRFAKGVSGNPGGRPPVAKEFRQKCREFMEREKGGWDMLIALASEGKATDRRYALELIAAYAYGKPKQGIEVTGEDGAPFGVVILPPAEVGVKSDGA